MHMNVEGKGVGGGSQFRREDRHCGTLGVYMYSVLLISYFNPYTVWTKYNSVFIET